MSGSMRVHDLSVAFAEGMPRFPAPWYPAFHMHEIAPGAMRDADWKRRFTRLDFFVHNGTHVESSDHVMLDGRTIDRIPLSSFIGYPIVLDFTAHPEAQPIDADAVARKLDAHRIPPASIVLIKTTYNDRHWGAAHFWEKSPYLTPAAARRLAALDLKLLGLDFQTEKPGEQHFPVHRELLNADTVLCEYLCNLDAIGPGSLFMAMPVRIEGAEASCVRAVAVDGLGEGRANGGVPWRL